MRVVVLGAGRVGTTIAKDLAAGGEFQVTVVDAVRTALDRLAGVAGIQVRRANLVNDAELRAVIEDHDIVVGSLPGDMGYGVLKQSLLAGKKIVDISFLTENPLELDGLAKEKGVVALVDCGIAPGCSNLILGRLEALLDRTDRFMCYVGGLPRVRVWPWEYKAPFSPIDVIEEYVRPARFVEQGEVVTAPALSEPELLDFPTIGTLEAFNTDGLRTLLDTVKVPDMKEKTLRYPGHIEKMRILREAGFFSKEPIQVNGTAIRPIDFTTALLFPAWRFWEREEDIIVMRIEVQGEKDGKSVTHSFELLDLYDHETETTAMARTSGYTCTACVRLLARGLYTQPGISPPEFLGRDPACYAFIMEELGKRGVAFQGTVQ